MRAAERVVGTTARIQAWARIDRMLVGIAAAVPYLFNNQPMIESRNVRGSTTCGTSALGTTRTPH